MGQRDDRTVALMAIRPRFVELILRGTKKVEFRKTRFRNSVTHVLIYSSGPVSKVVGAFEVEGLDEDSPGDLWDRYERIAGVTSDVFDAYYSGRNTGVAIRIGRVFELPKPLPLGQVCEDSNPPQSFRYLSSAAFHALGVAEPAGLLEPGVQNADAGDGLEPPLIRNVRCCGYDHER